MSKSKLEWRRIETESGTEVWHAKTSAADYTIRKPKDEKGIRYAYEISKETSPLFGYSVIGYEWSFSKAAAFAQKTVDVPQTKTYQRKSFWAD